MVYRRSDGLPGATPYYVGLLSAASLQGAAHQQPQQFQVVTTAPTRSPQERPCHSLLLQDHLQGNPGHSNQGSNGSYFVLHGATALDLIRYARSIGGLDRVMTVLQELGESMEPARSNMQ